VSSWFGGSKKSGNKESKKRGLGEKEKEKERENKKKEEEKEKDEEKQRLLEVEIEKEAEKEKKVAESEPLDCRFVAALCGLWSVTLPVAATATADVAPRRSLQLLAFSGNTVGW
jgi:hypothetical protein